MDAGLPQGVRPMNRGFNANGATNMWTLLVLAVVAVVVVVGIWNIAGGNVKVSGEYQAVFLTNNQVYFGKVASMGGEYVKLTDVYYLLLQKPLQNQQQKDEEGNLLPPPQPQFTLRKLGNEIHGPLDEMAINRANILFIEGLKEDSKVVKAIKDFKAQPQGAAVEAPAPTPVPAPVTETPKAPAPAKKTTK